MTDNDLLLKLANMIDHGQAGDMWDMNDVSEGDHARLPGLIRTLAQTEQQAALAWHCCDERYPWIQGIVTTSEITLDAWRDSGIKYQPLYPRAAQPPAAPVDLALLNEREIIRAEAEHSRSSAAAPVETEARDGAKRPDAPQWERRWPHDQPNGWNLHADQFLSLVNSAEGMMWLALGRAKYLELRVDTRDCGFNLYDRDGHPLNPDEVVEAVEKVKRDYGVGAEPHSRSSADTESAAVADQIIGQIEERFPNWQGFRDLIDCIDVTLHQLRGARTPTEPQGVRK